MQLIRWRMRTRRRWEKTQGMLNNDLNRWFLGPYWKIATNQIMIEWGISVSDDECPRYRFSVLLGSTALADFPPFPKRSGNGWKMGNEELSVTMSRYRSVRRFLRTMGIMKLEENHGSLAIHGNILETTVINRGIHGKPWNPRQCAGEAVNTYMTHIIVRVNRIGINIRHGLVLEGEGDTVNTNELQTMVLGGHEYVPSINFGKIPLDFKDYHFFPTFPMDPPVYSGTSS